MSVNIIELRDGQRIPIIGFGTWQMQGADAYQAVRSALEVGYRHIDTATVYENENEVGRALSDSGIPRENVFITTKIAPDGNEDASDTMDASLRALRSDYVDLWLIHWPPSHHSSLSMWRSILAVQSAGKARSLGVSNYRVDEIDELVDGTAIVPSVNQIRWSPFVYEPTVVEALRTRNILLEGYSPFKASRLRNREVVEIASTHGVSPAQIILRWHVQHGFVVIPKSVHPGRIAENFDIFNFALHDAEMQRLDSLSTGRLR